MANLQPILLYNINVGENSNLNTVYSKEITSNQLIKLIEVKEENYQKIDFKKNKSEFITVDLQNKYLLMGEKLETNPLILVMSNSDQKSISMFTKMLESNGKNLLDLNIELQVLLTLTESAIEDFVCNFYELVNKKYIFWNSETNRIWLFSNQNNSGVFINDDKNVNELLNDFILMVIENKNILFKCLKSSMKDYLYGTLGYARFSFDYNKNLNFIASLQYKKEINHILTLLNLKFDRSQIYGDVNNYIYKNIEDVISWEDATNKKLPITKIQDFLKKDESGIDYIQKDGEGVGNIKIDLNKNYNSDLCEELLKYSFVSDSIYKDKTKEQFKILDSSIVKYQNDVYPDVFEIKLMQLYNKIKSIIILQLEYFIEKGIDDDKNGLNFAILFSDNILNEKNPEYEGLYTTTSVLNSKKTGFDALIENLNNEFINISEYYNKKDKLIKENETLENSKSLIQKEVSILKKSINKQNSNEKKSEDLSNDKSILKNVDESKLIKLEEECIILDSRISELVTKITEIGNGIDYITRNLNENRSLLINEKLTFYDNNKTETTNQINTNIEECKKIIEEKNLIYETKNKWIIINLLLHPGLMFIGFGLLYYFVTNGVMFRVLFSVFSIFLLFKLALFFKIYFYDISKLNKKIKSFIDSNIALFGKLVDNQKEYYYEKHKYYRLDKAISLINELKLFVKEKIIYISELKDKILHDLVLQRDDEINNAELNNSNFNLNILEPKHLEYFFSKNTEQLVNNKKIEKFEWSLSKCVKNKDELLTLNNKVNNYIYYKHEEDFKKYSVEEFITLTHDNFNLKVTEKSMEIAKNYLDLNSIPLFKIREDILKDEAKKSEELTVGFSKDENDKKVFKNNIGLYGKLKIYSNLTSLDVIQSLNLPDEKYKKLQEDFQYGNESDKDKYG